MTTIEERKEYLLKRTSIATLMEASLALERIAKKSPEERMTAAWISDELEKRAGRITTGAEGAKFERAFDATGSYLAALIHVRPALLSSYAAEKGSFAARKFDSILEPIYGPASLTYKKGK